MHEVSYLTPLLLHLALSMLGTKFNRWYFEILFLFFPENRLWRFMQIITSNLFSEKNKKSITKTCLYNFDPLKPHFYIVKLDFTGVYIIFLISAQNIDCGYSLEPPRYPQSMFWAEIWKISEFFNWKFSFFGGKISVYLNRHVFLMVYQFVFRRWIKQSIILHQSMDSRSCFHFLR